MIQLRVEWVNPNHVLLNGSAPTIYVMIGTEMLLPVAEGVGFREFVIPPGTADLLLKVSFWPNLGAVDDAPSMQSEVFHAEQRYLVTDGETNVEVAPMTPYGQPHPLIDSKVTSGPNVAVLAQARTEFVDITAFWDHYIEWYAGNPQAIEFRTEREPGVRFVALGYTSGWPLIWFASIPDRMLAPAMTNVGALVFYRPTNYPYTRVDERHQQYPLNRYILSYLPDAQRGDRFWRSDHITKDDSGLWYFYLHCGMERSLNRSGANVLLLQPWPSLLNFGDAANARLPVATEQIIRFLYGIQALAVGGANVLLHRLALSGYSAGGDVLWASLGLNRDRVDEIYALDCNNTGEQGTRLRAWFKSRMDAGREPRLFFASGLGNNVAAGATIATNIQTNLSPPPGRVMSLPRTVNEYYDDSIPNWVFACQECPDQKANGAFLHQFPAYGRYPRTPGEPANAHPPFLQLFLERSGFMGGA